MKYPDGLLAMGGNLNVETLVTAYQSGIFPWFNEGEPILWWSPDPRMVLLPEELYISTSMKRVIRRETYRVTFDQAFQDVIRACSDSKAKTGRHMDYGRYAGSLHQASRSRLRSFS